MRDRWRVFVLEKKEDCIGGEVLTQLILPPNYSRNQSPKRYWSTSIKVTPMKRSPKLSHAVEPPSLRSKEPGKTYKWFTREGSSR